MVNLETAVTDGTCPEPQIEAVHLRRTGVGRHRAEERRHLAGHRGQRPWPRLRPAGTVPEPDHRVAGQLPDHRHREQRRPGLHPLPGHHRRTAHRDHRGDAGDRRQPRGHLDGHGHPARRGLGHRPDRAGARGAAGAPHGRHRDRLRALGHRDPGLPEPAAGTAGAATRQGRRRHRDRFRRPRPARGRLPRQRVRRLRTGQLRLLRQRRPRRPTAAALIITAEGRHITGVGLAPRHHPRRPAPAPHRRAGHRGDPELERGARRAPTSTAAPRPASPRLHGETIPFVAPPATTTTTTTSPSASTTSGGGTTTSTAATGTSTEPGPAAPRRRPPRRGRPPRRAALDDLDGAPLDDHVPDRQRRKRLTGRPRCMRTPLGQGMLDLRPGVRLLPEGVLARDAPIAEADLLQVVGLGDRLLRQPQHHVGLAPEHDPLLGRRGVEHDRAEGVDEPDEHRRHASCRLADLVEGAVDHAGVRRVGLNQAHVPGPRRGRRPRRAPGPRPGRARRTASRCR